ncbi:MAG TPA: hypothetical protein VL863_13980 [bacterium]|nr:hypothetical protein [bacterium]
MSNLIIEPLKGTKILADASHTTFNTTLTPPVVTQLNRPSGGSLNFHGASGSC